MTVKANKQTNKIKPTNKQTKTRKHNNKQTINTNKQTNKQNKTKQRELLFIMHLSMEPQTPFQN
jgi:hypothetical protein